ncbi:uncharacterized protein PG986_006574 [Apiospora aurea]|uniref:N-acetyltransferase domain-containing protein n=1 Tax=Apiospora aurea TaxID=335848 RepID=A0ABR1QKS5_9PEZI
MPSLFRPPNGSTTTAYRPPAHRRDRSPGHGSDSGAWGRRAAAPKAAEQPAAQASNTTIGIATEDDAEDDALVATLTGIVNRVYFDTENDIFVDGTKRTDEQEVRSIIQAGELAVLCLLPPPPASPGYQTQQQDQHQQQRKAIGCIRIRHISDGVGELGMMAIDPSQQGSGQGSALVRFAEEHIRKTLGLSVSRLELLVPSGFQHAFKARLQAWYDRLGYRMVRLGVFQDEYPKMAPLLRGPTEYRVFEKTLVAA